MRHRSLLLVPLLAPLLLAGCVNDTASYQIEGNDHALTVRVVQDVFWSKEGTVKLTAAHLPDCQRQISLGDMPLSGLEIELFASGPNLYTLRAGEDTWQVETAGCTQLEAPEADAVTGQALGAFHFDANKKLVFEAADAAPGADTGSNTEAQ
ncbi:hypothetical protein LQ564_16965 [Massilia sp. G4R7]|uniref:Lipoprotein n=1 Tax=Massilia phyllostachyos TaxID=2898585 RepID=A0ABS8Q8H5_9BURK|nr:hypothetical protein [Massilia phyllostachyos]MCD2518005.1 hypothetical protein [Massilia phyllostachyos]